MRVESVITSLVSLLVGGFSLLIALLLVMAPIIVVEYNLIAGALLLLFSLSLFVAGALVLRRRYLLIKMGGYSLSEKVLRDIAHKSVASVFPSQEFSLDVLVRSRGAVEVVAKLPVCEEEQLEELENRLTRDFATKCGYANPFLLNVSLH